MSKHVTEWLSPYLDGELHGSRVNAIEKHLAECEVCQRELQSLRNLSVLLQKVSIPESIPPERFAAQVSLHLPHQQRTTPRKKILEVGWWMIPVGLLVVWIFISTSFLVGDMLAVANRFGVLTSISDWTPLGRLGITTWSATLGQFGVLSGSSLELAATTEAFTRASILEISLQISIGVLYLSWIAILWARQTRHQPQQHGQLLEG